jgi:hypothetical protein
MPNDAAVIESNDATRTEPKDVLVAKRRSGSETRRRTDRLNLRLLPAEGDALRALAKEHGYGSVQALILEALRPLFASTEC